MIIVLLAICFFTLTTLSYTIGEYSYRGAGKDGMVENGFGLLDGESVLFSTIFETESYDQYVACNWIIFFAAILSFVVLLYYLITLIIPRAKLRLVSSATAIIGMNVACSVMYCIEGMAFAKHFEDFYVRYSNSYLYKVITYAYVPLIISGVMLILFLFVYALMRENRRAPKAAKIARRKKSERYDSGAIGADFTQSNRFESEGGEIELCGEGLDYLLELKDLYDAGALTDSEFAEETARILDKEFKQ